MNYHKTITYKENAGFALLMALVVVGVLLSIGLTVLELTITQVRLSTNARGSEVAFNATNAGLECAQYIRRAHSDDMEDGLSGIPVSCFGVSPAVTVTDLSASADVSGDGSVYQYEYEMSWGSEGTRCSEITTLVLVSDPVPSTDLTLANVASLIPGYESGSATCEAGARCTVLSSRGYNTACATKNSFGTLQREALLEF